MKNIIDFSGQTMSSFHSVGGESVYHFLNRLFLVFVFCGVVLFAPQSGLAEDYIFLNQGPTFTVSTNGLDATLSWTTVSGATGYRLYFAPYPYNGPSTLASIDLGSITGQTYTLFDGASYIAAIKAYNENGESGFSNPEILIIESSTDTGIKWGDFAITTLPYDDDSNWDQVVQNVFGSEYRVLDWNDLEAYFSDGNSLEDMLNGLELSDYEDGGFVYRNGSKNYSSTRYYFISRHNHSLPTTYTYLAHDNIDSYMISLGSWDTAKPILAVRNNAGSDWFLENAQEAADGTISMTAIRNRTERAFVPLVWNGQSDLSIEIDVRATTPVSYAEYIVFTSLPQDVIDLNVELYEPYNRLLQIGYADGQSHIKMHTGLPDQIPDGFNPLVNEWYHFKWEYDHSAGTLSVSAKDSSNNSVWGKTFSNFDFGVIAPDRYLGFFSTGMNTNYGNPSETIEFRNLAVSTSQETDEGYPVTQDFTYQELTGGRYLLTHNEHPSCTDELYFSSSSAVVINNSAYLSYNITDGKLILFDGSGFTNTLTKLSGSPSSMAVSHKSRGGSFEDETHQWGSNFSFLNNSAEALKDWFISNGFWSSVTLYPNGTLTVTGEQMAGRWWIADNVFYFNYPEGDCVDHKAYKVENDRIYFSTDADSDHVGTFVRIN